VGAQFDFRLEYKYSDQSAMVFLILCNEWNWADDTRLALSLVRLPEFALKIISGTRVGQKFSGLTNF
jgi:hypothetical protein